MIRSRGFAYPEFEEPRYHKDFAVEPVATPEQVDHANVARPAECDEDVTDAMLDDQPR